MLYIYTNMSTKKRAPYTTKNKHEPLGLDEADPSPFRNWAKAVVPAIRTNDDAGNAEYNKRTMEAIKYMRNYYNKNLGNTKQTFFRYLNDDIKNINNGLKVDHEFSKPPDSLTRPYGKELKPEPMMIEEEEEEEIHEKGKHIDKPKKRAPQRDPPIEIGLPEKKAGDFNGSPRIAEDLLEATGNLRKNKSGVNEIEVRDFERIVIKRKTKVPTHTGIDRGIEYTLTIPRNSFNIDMDADRDKVNFRKPLRVQMSIGGVDVGTVTIGDDELHECEMLNIYNGGDPAAYFVNTLLEGKVIAACLKKHIFDEEDEEHIIDEVNKSHVDEKGKLIGLRESSNVIKRVMESKSSRIVDDKSAVRAEFAAKTGEPIVSVSILDLLNRLNPKEDIDIVYTAHDMSTRGFKKGDVEKIAKMIADRRIKKLLEMKTPILSKTMKKTKVYTMGELLAIKKKLATQGHKF